MKVVLGCGHTATWLLPLRNYSVHTVPKQCRHAPTDPAHEEAIGPQKGAWPRASEDAQVAASKKCGTCAPLCCQCRVGEEFSKQRKNKKGQKV